MDPILPGAWQIRVRDRLDILDLYARQSHAVDSSNGAGWAATFTDDGVFTSPTYNLTARGPDELAEFARSSNDAALARGEQFRHVVTAVMLTPVSDGRIDSKAYLMIIATSETGTRIDRSLVMHDELRRVSGRWLVSSRETVRDH
ncbi:MULTISPECIES: nuclear transport factor 2 family protein [Microbacterium]|uniref:SnoaL-like domain-containing protein n=1 Tax=Microbacterium saccharophilum TaxID=1213358 RepID=A0A7Z7D2R2_9MICO|nr:MULTISPECIES: nuclear transport factor 2 family protein [Microbacterium]SFI60967.1 SnoaL-like domain-containing protein [Microbacterium saccharophilum]